MFDLSRREVMRSGAAVAAAAAAAALAVGDRSAAFASPSSAAQAPATAPKFKLGIVTYMIAAQWDLPTLLKVCNAVGIAGVELRATHKHGVSPSLSKEQRREVKKQFGDSHVEFWGCGSTCEFQSPDPKVVQKNIDECKEWIELVADLGGKGVKVRPNGFPPNATAAIAIEQIGKALITCGGNAKAAGIEIWVEVHGKGTAEPKNMHEIMDACGHPSVGLTWNSNPEDVKDGSIAESFELLGKWVRSCHINSLYNDAKGLYPYRELFKALREMGYDRYTMCEVPYSPSTPADGEAFLHYYKALWTELAHG